MKRRASWQVSLPQRTDLQNPEHMARLGMEISIKSLQAMRDKTSLTHKKHVFDNEAQYILVKKIKRWELHPDFTAWERMGFYILLEPKTTK